MRIVFLGDSLTAGHGIQTEEAYPFLFQKRAKEAGFDTDVVNGGVSGDTSANGRQRLPSLIKKKTDILIIALGTNDGHRGLSITQLRENLLSIIDTARTQYPTIKIILAGMKLPVNFEEQYRREFDTVYLDIARERDVFLLPFLMEGVGDDPSLNLGDKIHPSAKGHMVMQERVWNVLHPLLNDK